MNMKTTFIIKQYSFSNIREVTLIPQRAQNHLLSFEGYTRQVTYAIE